MILAKSFQYSSLLRRSVYSNTLATKGLSRNLLFKSFWKQSGGSPRYRGVSNWLDRNSGDYIIPGIIGVNLIVFGMWTLSENDRKMRNFMINNFTCCPFSVLQRGEAHTLVTCFFSHRDTWHLIGNMISCYFFGSTAVAALGASKFLRLYMTGGVISSAAFVGTPYIYRSPLDRGKYDHALGASGAVNAVVMWSICTFPRSLVYIYGIIPVPAVLFGKHYILCLQN